MKPWFNLMLLNINVASRHEAGPPKSRGLCVGLATQPWKKIEATNAKEERIRTGITVSKRKRNKDIRLATWNVRTLYRLGATRILTDELKKLRISVAAVQETRWPKTTQYFTSNGYQIYCSSNRDDHVLGTAFLVAQKWNHLVLNFLPIDERVCILRIKGRFKNYSLINAHALTNEAPDEEKEAFYEKISRVYDNCPRHDIKLILGDMNAKVGREEIFRPTIGKWSLHEETNENGLRLIDFAAEKGMVIKGTFFQRKRIHQATWESPDGFTKNQIDHCLIDGRHFSDVTNVKVCRGANVDSDHYLVVVDLRAHIDRAQTRRSLATRKFAINKLKDPVVSATFANRISTRVNQLQQQHPAPGDASEKWQHLNQMLKEEATDIIGFESPNDRNTWFDDDCARVTESKNAARIKKMERPTRSAVEQYRSQRREEKRIHKRKKREFQDRTLSELERLRNMNDSRKYYKILNDQRRGFNPQVNMCRALDGTLLTNKTDVLARWQEHFDDLLNGEFVANEAMVLGFLDDDGNEQTVPEPTREEVTNAIKSLKNNKSPGPDGIPAELLKNGGNDLIAFLHEIILEIWRTEKLPELWMEGALVPLYKKGDKLACENYRGISLLNAAYKTFARILYNRLVPHAETIIGDYQSGFRPDRSTSDQIHNIRLILQKGREFNIQTHHLFIDFKSAYDKTKRRELLVVMKEVGFEPKLIRLVAATLNGSKICIKLKNDMSNTFEVKDGLKQGDALSTLLFNVALEGAMRRAGIQSSRTLATSMVQILGFADDLDIVGRRHSSVVDTYASLKAEAERVGLIVNESKTKYMKTTSDSVPQQQANKVNICGQWFEIVDQFVYLGALIRADNDISSEIKRRTISANRCYHGLQRHLRSKLLTNKTKCNIYKTLIRPVLLYGSESWPLTRKDENLLLSFERKVLRTIFGAKLENGSFRRRYNFELERDFVEPNIVAIVKYNRLRWAGHVARMQESRAPRKLFDRDPDGRRSVGRPKMRWIDGVQADLRTLRVRNWRTQAQDRVSWNNLLKQARSIKWM